MSLARATELLEAAVGCKMSRLIQVSDHSIAITIANAAAAQTDTITIDGLAIPFTSDATPTKQEVSNGLIAAIAASAAAGKFTVTQGAGPNYDLSLKTTNELSPTVAVSANLADTPTDGEAILYSGKCNLVGIMFDANTTGVITIKDGATEKQILPIGMLKANTYLYYGAEFNTDLRFLVDAGADLGTVLWRTR